MPERSAAMMETLLGIHREQEPEAVLRFMMQQMQQEFGTAFALAYLLEPANSGFDLTMAGGPSGDPQVVLRRHDLRVPRALPLTAALPPIAMLSESGIPVHVTDQTPTILADLWGVEPAAALTRSLHWRFAAIAPVSGRHEPLGVLVLGVQEHWPVDIAAECAAHAAVALANLSERQGTVMAPERHETSGLYSAAYLEQAATREINRADRYRRMFSVTLVDLIPEDRTPATVQAIGELIHRLMRIPDIAGQAASGRIAVLLPETPPAGAAAFVKRLQEGGASSIAAVRFASASFPNDGRTWQELLAVATNRFDQPEAPTVPHASARGALRAAFPTFRSAFPGDRPSRYGL